jgi:lysozyme
MGGPNPPLLFMSDIEQFPNALLGIDVSHWQGAIEWDKVAESGVKFAWIKATEGNTITDPRLQANWQGAVANDIPFGFYHVWTPGLTNQAEFFLEAIHPVPHAFWGALDIEPGTLTTETDEELALAWMNAVYECGVVSKTFAYCSPSIAKVNMASPDWQKYPLWVAQYTSALQPSLVKWSSWVFWQRQCNGTVPGVPNPVDIDWFNGPGPLA